MAATATLSNDNSTMSFMDDSVIGNNNSTASFMLEKSVAGNLNESSSSSSSSSPFVVMEDGPSGVGPLNSGNVEDVCKDLMLKGIVYIMSAKPRWRLFPVSVCIAIH